jgi:hypothetical protein
MHELTVAAEINFGQRRKCVERCTFVWNDRNRDKTVRETEFHVRIPAGKEYTKFGTPPLDTGIGVCVWGTSRLHTAMDVLVKGTSRGI